MSTKKIKFENDFNIIRDLYLNKENRNLLDEFLKYLNRDVRYKFMINILKNTNWICKNCFVQSQMLYNTQCGGIDKPLFCGRCLCEHFDKYSEYLYCDYVQDSNLINIRFSHKCDLYDTSNLIIKSAVNRFLIRFTNVEKLKSNPSDSFSNKNFKNYDI